jgi:hypothetical protein
VVPTTQDDLQDSRDGHRHNDTKQAKKRPAKQNRYHHDDRM